MEWVKLQRFKFKAFELVELGLNVLLCCPDELRENCQRVKVIHYSSYVLLFILVALTNRSSLETAVLHSLSLLLWKQYYSILTELYAIQILSITKPSVKSFKRYATKHACFNAYAHTFFSSIYCNGQIEKVSRVPTDWFQWRSSHNWGILHSKD